LSATQIPVNAATSSLPELKEEDLSGLTKEQLLSLVGSRHFSINARFPNLAVSTDILFNTE
jgi:hypothetical protein